jgi:hypothetical protein
MSGREWPGKGKFILEFQKKFKSNQAHFWEGEEFLGNWIALLFFESAL